MHRASVCGYIGVFLALCSCATSTACAQGPDWRHQNDRGNRYEGVLQTIPNGGANFEVREFSAVTDAPLANFPQKLHLLYYAPAGQEIGNFQVKERTTSAQYLMIPILKQTRPGAWNRFENWPVSDVILPRHVHLDNLAVLAHIVNPQGADVVTPAILYGDKLPTVVKEYRLDVFIYKPLSVINCVIVDSAGKVLPLKAGESPCTKRSPGGRGTQQASTAEFAILAAGLPLGPLTIRLSGRYQNDDSPARFNSEIHFYNQPALPR